MGDLLGDERVRRKRDLPASGFPVRGEDGVVLGPFVSVRVHLHDKLLLPVLRERQSQLLADGKHEEEFARLISSEE